LLLPFGLVRMPPTSGSNTYTRCFSLRIGSLTAFSHSHTRLGLERQHDRSSREWMVPLRPGPVFGFVFKMLVLQTRTLCLFLLGGQSEPRPETTKVACGSPTERRRARDESEN
jgi:hypothetical protein